MKIRYTAFNENATQIFYKIIDDRDKHGNKFSIMAHNPNMIIELEAIEFKNVKINQIMGFLQSRIIEAIYKETEKKYNLKRSEFLVELVD